MIRKTITGAAIAAVAVTLLLTFSNTAYSSPIGDQVTIRVQNEKVDVDTIVTVDNDLTEFTVAIPTTLTSGSSVLTIDIGVDNAGNGRIWLTYEDNGNLVPFHSITISDIDWIDPNTNEPISGSITDVQCESDLVSVNSFSGNSIVLLTVDAFDPTDIHCTFFAEHESPPPPPTTDPREPVRDNVDIENIKLKQGAYRVIVDNAGRGGTSDVEITWKFNNDKCMLIAAGDIGGFGTVVLENDGAFTSLGIPVGHNDVDFAEAILLTVVPDAKDCKIDSKKGEYVSVSTIGMGGPGPLDTSNPTGP